MIFILKLVFVFVIILNGGKGLGRGFPILIVRRGWGWVERGGPEICTLGFIISLLRLLK